MAAAVMSSSICRLIFSDWWEHIVCFSSSFLPLYSRSIQKLVYSAVQLVGQNCLLSPQDHYSLQYSTDTVQCALHYRQFSSVRVQYRVGGWFRADEWWPIYQIYFWVEHRLIFCAHFIMFLFYITLNYRMGRNKRQDRKEEVDGDRALMDRVSLGDQNL